MTDGTIIRKETSYNAYKTNHFEMTIDGIEILRLSIDSVDLSYKDCERIAVKLLCTESTVEYFNGNDGFSINSNHRISIKLYNDDTSIVRYLVDDEMFSLKEKSLSLGYSKSDALYFELIFEKV